MSSRTATDSGDGFGSSPKAYIKSFTLVRFGREEFTIFLEEILFPGVATGAMWLVGHCRWRMSKGGDVQLQLKCSFTGEREMNIPKLYIDTANIIIGNS